METSIAPLKESVDLFLYENQNITISTREQYLSSGDILKQIKNRIKSLEEQRVSYTRPLDESKKKIMSDFKEVIEPLEQLEGRIKSSMIVWASAEQKRLDEEQKKIEAEAIKNATINKVSEIVVPVVNTSVKTQRGTVSTNTIVKRWVYRIVDEMKIPREYLAADTSKIWQAVRGGVRNIEGTEIYQEDTLVTR